MLDTTEKAYTLYNCDKVIDEVAYRLTRDDWYGYKQFHNHSACVELNNRRIELYFHPYIGYQALVIDNGASFYNSISWKNYTGNVSDDVNELYDTVMFMVQKYDHALSLIQKDE